MFRKIKIEAAMNGFIVQIGCQRAVFNDVYVMTQEIAAYFNDPYAVEKRYTALPNAQHTYVGPAMPSPTPQGAERVSAQTTRGGASGNAQQPPVTCGTTR